MKDCFSFDHSVFVTCWQTNEVLVALPARTGFGVMARSHRWDPLHTSSQVRTLDVQDAMRLNADNLFPSTPIVFSQERVYPPKEHSDA